MAIKDLIDLPPIPQEIIDKYADKPPEDRDRIARAAYIASFKGKLKAISPNPQWGLEQVLMQEVFSAHAVKDPNKKVVANEQKIIEYRDLVLDKYGEDPEIRDMLLTCTPSLDTIKKWMKKPGWDDAVWNQIRTSGLFTKERRSAMINAVFNKGIKGDTNAAKLWLTLSGDLIENQSTGKNEAILDKFRDINKILHSRKTEE